MDKLLWADWVVRKRVSRVRKLRLADRLIDVWTPGVRRNESMLKLQHFVIVHAVHSF